MPRNAPIVAPGLPYHVTQRSTNRENVFFAVADRYLYLRLLRDNLADVSWARLARLEFVCEMEERFQRRWRRSKGEPLAEIALSA